MPKTYSSADELVEHTIKPREEVYNKFLKWFKNLLLAIIAGLVVVNVWSIGPDFAGWYLLIALLAYLAIFLVECIQPKHLPKDIRSIIEPRKKRKKK